MRDVLRINPKNAGALNYIGYTYADQGENLDEALSLIEQALLLRPTDGYITDSLGWVYFKRGEREKAIKYLMKANTMVPGEPTVLTHLGTVLEASGDLRGALKLYERALDAGLKKQERDDDEIERIRQKIEQLKGKL